MKHFDLNVTILFCAHTWCFLVNFTRFTLNLYFDRNKKIHSPEKENRKKWILGKSKSLWSLYYESMRPSNPLNFILLKFSTFTTLFHLHLHTFYSFTNQQFTWIIFRLLSEKFLSSNLHTNIYAILSRATLHLHNEFICFEFIKDSTKVLLDAHIQITTIFGPFAHNEWTCMNG